MCPGTMMTTDDMRSVCARLIAKTRGTRTKHTKRKTLTNRATQESLVENQNRFFVCFVLFASFVIVFREFRDHPSSRLFHGAAPTGPSNAAQATCDSCSATRTL